MLKVIVGHSNDPDSAFAIAEVLAQCHHQLADLQPKAALLFAAPDFDHRLILQTIHQHFHDLLLIGGTSDGELSSTLGVQQDSIVLTLFCSDEITFSAAVGRHISENLQDVVYKTVDAAQQALKAEIRLCITTPESLTISAVDLLDSLTSRLGDTVPVIGGTTTDQWQFGQTYQFFGTEVLSDAIPILLLAGDFKFGYGVASGWTPVGKIGTVTKVDGNVLYEVNGEPALDFYKGYLGNSRPSPAYRLAVFAPESDYWYIRTSNGTYSETDGRIAFFADIPAGSTVQVVRANRDDIIVAADTSLQSALTNYSGTNPDFALFLSCAGRLQVLGTRADEVYNIVEQRLGQKPTCCGFYTYGEIAPLFPGKRSHFHNETFITLLLGSQ
ncbi:MAG: FIST N-terminal domain-containing protein [Cyanobacteria bacterium P01_A01_bin.15]